MSTAQVRYSDCALIEIIHLHDCLRNALTALSTDVHSLAAYIPTALPPTSSRSSPPPPSLLPPHSTSPSPSPSTINATHTAIAARFQVIWSVFQAHSKAEDEFIWPALYAKIGKAGVAEHHDHSHSHDSGDTSHADSGNSVDAQDYKDDHDKEDRLFSQLNDQVSRRCFSP